MFTATTIRWQEPRSARITPAQIRKTLRDVQSELRRHEINGGDKTLRMDGVCHTIYKGNKCKTAACIGGWVGVFLLGTENEEAVERLFNVMADDNRLHALFHEYGNTESYNNPDVAAQAIERYFDRRIGNDNIWPHGVMPMPAKPKRATKKRQVKRRR